MKLLILAAVSCQLIALVTSDVKTWTKNTNYDDPTNWNGGGIACSNDRKIFPKDLIASVYVQKNESIQELILSDNMVVTFGEGIVLTFNTALTDSDSLGTSTPSSAQKSDTVSIPSTSPPPKCSSKGRVLEFQAKSSSWFDPASWTTQQTTNNGSSRFLLDLEKVPCKEDKIVFPSKNTFSVDLEGKNIQASSMLIHSEEFNSQAAFNNYWAGIVSPYEFVSRAEDPPVITGLPCGDDVTCQCTDRYSAQMKEAVCKYRKCNEALLSCKKPISPKYGQCCNLCGSKLQLTVQNTQANSLYTSLHNKLIDALQANRAVKYTIGPLVNSTLEIVLIDGGDGAKASLTACDLRKLLLSNETAYNLGIADISFERSDGVETCSKASPTSLPVTSSPPVKWDYIIIGVSLSIGLVGMLLVILGVFLYRRKYVGGTKNEMELGRVGARSSQGFDNPVYDTPLPFEDSFIVTYDASDDQINGFENVLYTPNEEANSTPPTSLDKKVPVEDPYAPVIKKSKKRFGKKQKEAKNVGFDNPVYAEEGEKDGSASMESVPLDEDEHAAPHVSHDGTGFVNPIATGLSEEMMAPPLPKKVPASKRDSKGFANPLYDEEESASGTQEESDLGESTLQIRPATVTKKKKAKNGKAKEHKGKNGNVGKIEKGFENPVYEVEDDQSFYQPETIGEEDDGSPSASKDEEEL